MGTSSARHAPAGPFWRQAKTAAARFASGTGVSPPQVNEVVARYLTALKSHNSEPGGTAAAFLPDLVRTATALGNFYLHWQHHGRDETLERLGVSHASSPALAALLPALLDRLAGTGSRLDEAVARTALSEHLEPFLSAAETSGPSQSAPVPSLLTGVCHFFGLALFRKLLADLGEPLEFHAPNISRGLERQEELKVHILNRIQTLTAAGTEVFSLPQTAALLDRLVDHLGGRHDR